MDFFLRGQLKDHVYALEYLVSVLQTAVVTVDATTLRRILQNSVRCTTVCVEMDCSRFEHQFKLRRVHVLIIL